MVEFKDLSSDDLFIIYDDVAIFFEALYQGSEEVQLYKKTVINGRCNALNVRTNFAKKVYDEVKVIRICS